MYIKLSQATLAAVLLFSGCGGGGNDTGVSFDATVNYKTSAAYDFLKYMIPSTNAINLYSVETYENKDGEKRFKGDPDRSTYSEKYDINGTQITLRNGQDEIEEIYDIRSDRIVEKEDANASGIAIARFIDPGDYMVVSSTNRTEDKIPIVDKVACKFVKHIDTKMIDDIEYSDILELSCKNSADGSNDGANISIKYHKESSESLYFAKDIGMVESETVSCTDITTTLNGQEQHNASCEKEIKRLVSHNKL